MSPAWRRREWRGTSWGPRARAAWAPPSSLVAAVIARLEAATDAASEAVLEVSERPKPLQWEHGNRHLGNPASCTFVAAVVELDLLVVGSVGDSRAYWLPDAGSAIALTLDDSFAQEQIASGVPRAEAESGPQSHAITRWLGVDAPDHTPTTATMTLAEPGWLMVCSDGLWNYCSAAQDLAALVQQTASTHPAVAEPLALLGHSSTGPTPKAARTTSPSPWPGSGPEPAAFQPHSHPRHRRPPREEARRDG